MIDTITGRVWRFGHNLDADQDIFPFGQVMQSFSDQDEAALARYCLTPIDPTFPDKASPGDILVAGRNFGVGKPHAQGILAMKGLRLGAVICDSVSPGYFRKSVVYGLPMLPCPGVHDLVETGHQLQIRVAAGTVVNLTTRQEMKMPPLPEFLADMILGGGLTPFLQRRIASRTAGSA